MSNSELEQLCEKVGYRFRNPELLRNALTHSSYCYEHELDYKDNNERLEFLGDALLDAIIGEQLFLRMQDLEEGGLSKLRASVVCEEALLRKADELDMIRYIRMGRGEALFGSQRGKRSLLADAVEALIGAIYLDSSWETVRQVISGLFSDLVDDAVEGKLSHDYKSRLQELLQTHHSYITYKLMKKTGPDHDQTFYMAAVYEGKVIGQGSGRSKKIAEQNAAREALQTMKLREADIKSSEIVIE